VGTVIMATQYNANDAPFANKQEMMEYDAAVSGKVSGNIMAGVECDPKQNSGSPGKYTRSGPVAPNEDVKTFDLGTLNVATSNTPGPFSNQALGELWVSYTVELRKPKFFVSRALQNQKDIWLGNAATGTQITMDTLTLGEGQQNRIGGILATSAQNISPQVNNLLYTFPATFAGDVEISALVSRTNNAANGLEITWSNPNVSIIPIKDIYTDMGLGAGGLFTAVENDTTGGYTMKAIAHLKIITPTSAATTQDNVIRIQLMGGAGATCGTLNFMVSTYNTGLNFATSNQPIIQNPETSVVESWPPA